MRGMFGSAPGGMQGRRDKAQDLAYEAMEADDAETAGTLALQAIRLDPECTDALHLLAELDHCTTDQFVARLRKTVDAGARRLGRGFFEENKGYFWGLLETRPYMRARASLAQALAESGRMEEAIGHYQEMLELNPNDNQGLRDLLLGLYLERGDLDGARRLFKQYENGYSAVFAWARVLERLLAGDETGADKALKEARNCNNFVAGYLTGRKKLPAESPDYYSPGKDSEAVVCMQCIGAAWKRHPDAVAWLKRAKA
jgi:tetratricopeptide (TPR) repeat protein